jgi:hypothetical protein
MSRWLGTFNRIRPKESGSSLWCRVSLMPERADLAWRHRIPIPIAAEANTTAARAPRGGAGRGVVDFRTFRVETWTG